MPKLDSAIALNRQGIAYFANKKYADAVNAYQSAIDMRPDYIDAYYNLGLALQKMRRLDLAELAYGALIELSPHHLGGRFQLGCLCMEKDNILVAVEHFSLILKEQPAHVETQINLAACLLKLGRLREAKSWYMKVIAVWPDEISVLFNLGVICMQLGCVKEAIAFYSTAIRIDNHFYDALHNLGVAYLALKETVSALSCFQAALRIKPDNDALRYTVSALQGDKALSGASPAYIRELFNAYAAHYEAHLQQALHYQVPQRLLALLQAVMPLPVSRWDVLDLGCGTGLAGAMFKPLAQTLVGVDLADKMLEVAAGKQIYDALFALDILFFLQDKQAAYDLVVAADVLVYFGDLAPLFAAVAMALKPGGLLVFNTEVDDHAENYKITSSGRFTHRLDYVQRLMVRSGLMLRQSQMATLRTQHEVDVLGCLWVLQRQS